MSNRSNAVLLAALVLSFASCSRDPQKVKTEYLESGNRYAAKKNYPEAIVEYRNAVSRDPNFGEARFQLAGAYAETGDVRNALREYVRAADLMPKDLDAQLRAGNGLLAAKQYPEAKARAIAALNIDPKNVNALVLLGNSMARMKDLDGAISQLQQAIDSDPRETLTYANLGAMEMAKGDRVAAEKTFQRAVALAPKSATAHLGLANYYWAVNQRPDAERELKIALDNDPKSLPTLRALAVFYAMSNRSSESEPYLKTYAELSSDVAPKLMLADFYLLQDKIQQSRSVLEPLLNIRDGFIPANVRLAAMDFVSGARPKAYQILDEVLKRDEKNEEALLEKARFLMAEGKVSDALALASAVVTTNPNSAGGQYLRGIALKATGSPDEAVKAFQEVLRLRPTSAIAAMQVAELSLGRGDAAAAADYASQAITNQPQSGTAHELLARALIKQGNLGRAEREVLGLAKDNPASAEIQTLVGDFYLAKGDSGRAREAFERSLKGQGSSIAAVRGLITLDLKQNKPAVARSTIDAELAKRPDDKALSLLAGETFLALGDLQRAETVLRHVLQLDPSNFQAYSRLGMMYGSQNRLDEARKEFEELSRRQPKAAVVAMTMVGTILTLQNKPDEARKQYEQALALDPRTPVAANNLAWDYAETGNNLDVALQLAQTAKSQLPNSAEISDTLGWIYYKKGLAGLAVTSLQEATKQAPSDPSIHYRLGLAYLKNGDKAKARGSFEQALKLNPQFREADDARRALATVKG